MNAYFLHKLQISHIAGERSGPAVRPMKYSRPGGIVERVFGDFQSLQIEALFISRAGGICYGARLGSVTDDDDIFKGVFELLLVRAIRTVAQRHHNDFCRNVDRLAGVHFLQRDLAVLHAGNGVLGQDLHAAFFQQGQQLILRGTVDRLSLIHI